MRTWTLTLLVNSRPVAVRYPEVALPEICDTRSIQIHSDPYVARGQMQLARRLRIPALLCAFAVLLCELISWPYTNVSVIDDGPYILMARTLASTGHVVYNGGEAAMIAFQLYLGAAFIKLFGFSFTTVRMSTLLAAMVLAFLLQRTLARTGITERNATIGTVALVLSPLYLMLAATFMSDITGLLAIVLCLYGCLRALQSSTDRSMIGWLSFAVVTNVICGTSRQIAWLGVLVMVPSTLWLLRAQRRALFAGAAATLAGVVFIVGCMQWLKHQPYIIPAPPFVRNLPIIHVVDQLVKLFLDVPFLLLPTFALFIPEIRKSRPRIIAILSTLLLGFIFFATYPSNVRDHFSRLLEPTVGGKGSWITTYEFDAVLRGATLFLHPWAQVLLTIVAYGGLIGLVICFLRTRNMPKVITSSSNISWKQLGIVLIPFTLAYSFFVLSAAGTTYYLYDRYALGLLVVPLIFLVRYYQERIRRQIPLAALIPVALMAIYGIAVTHNIFAFDRARTELSAELAGQGVPATSVDNGWDYNFDVELQHADHINDPRIKTPANSYTQVPPPPPGPCEMFWYDRTPHIRPIYGLSLDPTACGGLAPFAPVHYSRWPMFPTGTIYVVRYTAR
jgi:hypothetical protein